MRDDRTSLLEAIARIEKYAAKGRSTFDQDELIQIWFVNHIQIIGEATRKLTKQLRDSHPEIPWSQIAAMRNVLVHDYFGIDLEEVWLVVQKDIPDLKGKVEAILKKLGPAPQAP